MAYSVSVMADASVRAHAQRLGLPVEALMAALVQYATRELFHWTEAGETADPGSVWHTGDVPDWLEPYIESLRHGMATAALAAIAQEVA
jgi:hypothetical protein